MRKFVLVSAILLILIVFAIATVLFWLTSPVTIAGNKFVEIERGTSTRTIAQQLAEEGIIRSPYALLFIRALRPSASLQAGEYEFSGELSAWRVFDKIRLGQVFYEEVTIPEGSNMFDIAAILDKTDTVTGADFVAAAKSPNLIRDLDPVAPTLEGYLFPSTYRITHRTTAHDLCHNMTQEFRKQWRAISDGRTGVHRATTLASLVEKETAIPQERPLVAAVFLNRLRLNMPLQCDPTTVYAAILENRYNGVIHKSDLASQNAYNTYQHAGLPPGPIANPGMLSLRAVLKPTPTDALYFVAKGDGSGSHRFSSTLAEHVVAVKSYRKTEH